MNDSDPLAALRPIHLPPEIGWWPPAFGWWMVAAVLALTLALLCLLALRRWKANRYRRAALLELEVLADGLSDPGSQAAFAAAANTLLRRVALRRYPSREVAALTGQSWLAFLDRSGRMDAFSHGPGLVFAEAAYDPTRERDNHALHRVCRDWLRRHR